MGFEFMVEFEAVLIGLCRVYRLSSDCFLV